MAEEIDDRAIQVLNEIFVKAAKEPEFRAALLKDASSVLDKYDLSSQSKQMILEAIKEMQDQG